MEQGTGARQSRDGTRVWVDEAFVRDREQDHEMHRVTYPDGRPEHLHEGKLSEKTGHGSDKPEVAAARKALKEQKAAERLARKAERDRAYAARREASEQVGGPPSGVDDDPSRRGES